jgi:spore coat protein H
MARLERKCSCSAAGDGPVYWGLYSIIEDPSDRMLRTQLGDDSGNLNKPWGDAAGWLSLEQIGQDEVEAYFGRSNNEGDTDWSDVIEAIAALPADRSDPESWRSALEATFDVQSFIKTLAINQVMVNWDSYGCMHHNYYVHANPLSGGRLLWFPWDLNEAMLYRTQSGCRDPGSVMLDEIVYADPTSGIDADWPLIQFILADSEYRASYRTELQAALDGAFAANTVTTQIRQFHDLIASYVVGPDEVESFPYTNCTDERVRASLETGDNALIPHVSARRDAVAAALEP